jgi:3-hydroxyisobutyrate dehydrogenase-like beta-hydroxyacid dehydrogenase
LFKACEPYFAVMGKKSFLLGATGAGARMKLVSSCSAHAPTLHPQGAAGSLGAG